MTLADKIKELREAKNREDANSAFNDDASVMQRAYFHRELSNMLPKLLDCMEIQAEALAEIASWCPTPKNPDDCKVAECKVSRDAIAKVEALFSSEANTNHSARRGN